MDSLDRFLTTILKDLKAHGFLETIEKLSEYSIKKGFEFLAETAIDFLKNIIQKGYYLFTGSSNNTNNNSSGSNNSIFDIIMNIIKKFSLPDFKTIMHYINAAIDLLKKLLKNFWFKKSAPTKMKETKKNEEMPTTPTKLCDSFYPSIKIKTDMRENSIYVTEIRNRNPNNKLKADIPVTRKKYCPSHSISAINPNPNNKRNAIIKETQNNHVSIENTSPNGTAVKIVGTKRANTNFKGVQRKIIYYVGQVSLGTTEQNIIDELTKTIPGGNFECRKLKTGHKTQSFRLTANFSSKQGLENPKNWPEGVTVRPWVWKNKEPTNTMQDNMAGSNGIEVA